MGAAAENLMTVVTIVGALGSVAGPVIQAIGRPDFEDVLRTRSPGEVTFD